ncbi:hypothetical protein AAG906_022289 [Vitis piasezkii]
MVTMPSIERNSDYRAQPFHSELYFDIEVLRQQPELQDSFGLLHRYHLEHLMTLREFFYPRRDMVRILSRGTSSDPYIIQKELPSGMLLIDVLLRSLIYWSTWATLLSPTLSAAIIDEHSTESVPHAPTPSMPEATSTVPPPAPTAPTTVPIPESTFTTPPVPPATSSTSKPFMTISATEFRAMLQDATTVEARSRLQEATIDPSSSHDPTTS